MRFGRVGFGTHPALYSPYSSRDLLAQFPQRTCRADSRCIQCLLARLLPRNMFPENSFCMSTRCKRLYCCSTFPRCTKRTLSCHSWRTCPHHKQCSRHPPWCSLGQRRSCCRRVHRFLLTFACPRHKHYTRFGLFPLNIPRMRNLCSLTSWNPR